MAQESLKNSQINSGTANSSLATTTRTSLEENGPLANLTEGAVEGLNNKKNEIAFALSMEDGNLSFEGKVTKALQILKTYQSKKKNTSLKLARKEYHMGTTATKVKEIAKAVAEVAGAGVGAFKKTSGS